MSAAVLYFIKSKVHSAAVAMDMLADDDQMVSSNLPVWLLSLLL